METLAESGIMLFVPKMYDIVWSAVILVIVALFFYKFFLPKFQAVFDERAAKIEGGIAKAEQAQKAQAEAEAKQKAQAENDAAQITATAQRSIESQQQQALVSLKGEVGALATALAGKILGSELQDEKVQSSMIDQMIDSMESDKQ